ncbi:MAG: hypothetical protein K1X28_02680 [Parachlamydiales bacterium]|nr:hypothetical protein [Parachlamydiales bacterium]
MKEVRSFDLFDTLIGRRHFFPQSTYDLVEKHFPFPGFAFYRQAAAAKSDHTLPDIYRHMQQMLDLSDDQAKTLMEFEFQTDLNQIFPIHETLNQIEHGDLIVSDTYYDLSQVQQILKKIGLKKKVHIYATPAGKYFGTVWEGIKKKHQIISHLGDSLHSDVEMALSKEIPGQHYAGSTPTAIEKAMIEFGQNELGCLMRTLRLQNPYPKDSPEYLLWNEQTQLNVPLLIQASLYLSDFCQKKKKSRVLFTSRDGCLWIQIFKTLFPHYESIYYFSSRYTYLYPTQSFVEYVKSIYSDESVIADTNGSGKSCQFFFRNHMKIEPTYFSIVNSKEGNHCILRKDLAHEGVEKMNYDVVGALYDVQDGKPCRSSPEYDLSYIRPSHACIAKCVEYLPYYRFDRYDEQIVEWAVTSMEKKLEIENHVFHAKVHAHIEENNRMRTIHVLESGHFFETPSAQ